MTPLYEIKCTGAGINDAVDLLHAVMDGKVRLFLESGSKIEEKANGRTLVATRLKHGGVMVREVVPKTRDAWEDLEDGDLT